MAGKSALGAESRSASALPHYVATCHKPPYIPVPFMLHSYVPALVFLFLGAVVGVLFTYLTAVRGPPRPNPVKSEPYESGLPSEVKKTFRFGISFYLVAM